jgi:ATP-dependent DNA helicase PIF1
MILKRHEGPISTYLSADCPVDESESSYAIFLIEFLHSLTPTGVPPHNLQLKRGSFGELLRNLSIYEGLYDGTQLLIFNSGQHIIVAELLVGNKKGEFVMIPRITLTSLQDDPSVANSFTRQQFPVQLRFSMTINKAQGQTLDRVGLLLQAPVISHGQLYDALSRFRSLEAITVQLPNFP